MAYVSISDAEWQVMNVVWDGQPLTAQEIVARLDAFIQRGQIDAPFAQLGALRQRRGSGQRTCDCRRGSHFARTRNPDLARYFDEFRRRDRVLFRMDAKPHGVSVESGTGA